MPDSLSDLEKRRSEVLAEISTLGDFRPGSISATGGRCGTPNCHCHKPDDPGHGPNFRLTYKVDGKTVTESFPSLAAQRKAEREVAGFRTYQQLSRSLIDTNEKICRARPVEDTLTPLEKKRRKLSGRKSNGKKARCCVSFSRTSARLPDSIWKRSRWRCGRRCIGPDSPGRAEIRCSYPPAPPRACPAGSYRNPPSEELRTRTSGCA